MPIGTDFSIAANGDIRHIVNTTNYTVLEFHQWLSDLGDDQTAIGDDIYDISIATASDRSTDTIITLVDHSANSGPIFNIDDNAAEYIYNGSISQKGSDELYAGLQVLGAVNTAATQVMIIQDKENYQFTPTPASPFWGTQATGGYNGNSASGILMQILVKVRQNGADIDGKRIRLQVRHWGDTYDFFNVTMGDGVSVGALGSTPDAQNTTLQATVDAYTHVVNSGGTIPNLTGGYQTIDLGNGNGAQPYYSGWTYGADTSADGLKGVWEYIKNISRTGASDTIDSLIGDQFVGISHEIDYDGQTANFTERATLLWGTEITYDALVAGPFTPGNYVTIGINGAAGRVMDDNGTATLIVALDNTAITLLDNDVITEYPGVLGTVTSTTAVINVTIVDNNKAGGSGLILADNDAGATGTVWMQLLTGSAPVDNLPIIDDNGIPGDGVVNLAPTLRTLPKIFLGSYTGNLIGAFGIGVVSSDLVSTDRITDLLAVNQTPPNNVTFSVTGLVSGEDRVLTAPRTGVIINKAQMALNTTLIGAAESAVIVGAASIPSDSPSSGTIRVVNDSGYNIYLPFSSHSGGNTFNLTGTYDFSGAQENDTATAGVDVYITYIDKLSGAATESFTVVFNATRDLFVRVRDGGTAGDGLPIKTFESNTAQLTSTGGSVGVIRTSDA